MLLRRSRLIGGSCAASSAGQQTPERSCSWSHDRHVLLVALRLHPLLHLFLRQFPLERRNGPQFAEGIRNPRLTRPEEHVRHWQVRRVISAVPRHLY
jgi:hypothetical protein